MMGRWSEQLAAKFIASTGVGSCASILDVGCGTGSLVSALLDDSRVSRLVGIDRSQSYVDTARTRFSDPRVRFERADAHALPFADHTFDAACALLVMKFLAQPEHVLGEMVRVVRPGGIVAAADWDIAGGFVTNRLFWDTAAIIVPGAASSRDAFFALPMTRPGEMNRAWVAARLREVTEAEVTIRMVYESFDDYWEPIAAGDGYAGQWVSSLPPDSRATLRSAVQAGFESGRRGGHFTFAATALLCQGVVP